MIINEDIRKPLTASSGAASVAITDQKNKTIKNIYINPATASTTYDFSITDKNSEVIYQDTGLAGKYSIDTKLYLYGDITIALANASADEAFVIILTAAEGVNN